MSDLVQNFMFDNHPVRGQFVRLESVYQKVLQQQDYPAPVSALLAEALVAVLLLKGVAKSSGKLSLQFQSQGAISLISVQCDQDFYVRGLIQFAQQAADDEALEQALSGGQLQVLLQSDQSRQQYQSVVPIQGHSIAASIEHYFMQSDQQITQVRIERNAQHLVGFLLQLLPEESDTKATSWEHVTQLAETLQSEELLDLDNEAILHRLYHSEAVRVFPGHEVSFGCQDREKRFENAILSLGKVEAENLLSEHSTIAVTCEFCQKVFEFDSVDIEKLFKGGETSDSETKH